jgi:hypothetical protein
MDMLNACCPQSPRVRKRAFFSIAVSVLFALGLAFEVHHAIGVLARWRAARDWVEAKARLTRLNPESRTSHNSSAYELRCMYEYDFRGKTYQGYRMGVDNIGTFYTLDLRARADRLWTAREAGSPVPCYVDPRKPDRALLDRDLDAYRILSYAAITLLLVMIILFYLGSGIKKWRLAEHLGILELTYPGQPWMWKSEWAAGIIGSNTGLTASRACASLVLWIVMGGPVAFLIGLERWGGGQTRWIVLLVIHFLVCVALIFWAARSVSLHRRLGRSRLEMPKPPGVIGDGFRGNLVLNGELAGLEAVDVVLSCEQLIQTGFPFRNYTKKAGLWRDLAHFEAPSLVNDSRISLPVEFQIPEDCPPTSNANPKEGIEWIIVAQPTIRGRMATLEFSVPVFQPESRVARM